MGSRLGPFLTGILLLSSGITRSQDWERPPIRYGQSTPENAVTRLQDKLDRGEASLTFEPGFGYLKSVLRELNIPVSSQTLVFSKTSLQRDRISPKRPRAVYFGDEAYVGFCQRGKVIEVSVSDPKLGTSFYTLDQEPAEKPQFQRQTEHCLVCHGSSATQGAPGHLVRSLYTDPTGQPILSLGSHRIDQTSPLAERWGGWYVTGTSGEQKHLGNLIVPAGTKKREEIDSAAGVNRTDLADLLALEAYLSPHSDIVALMVMEHQTEMHNRFTRANFQTRQALYEEGEIRQALGRSEEERSDSIRRRIESAAEDVVEYMLFVDEAPLTGPIRGTSSFAQDYAAQGKRDAKGRSLRDFDLERRLFKYPCSPLIVDDAFQSLPEESRGEVLRQLAEILTGRNKDPKFNHLSADDRSAILEIVQATVPNLPAEWGQ